MILQWRSDDRCRRSRARLSLLVGGEKSWRRNSPSKLKKRGFHLKNWFLGRVEKKEEEEEKWFENDEFLFHSICPEEDFLPEKKTRAQLEINHTWTMAHGQSPRLVTKRPRVWNPLGEGNGGGLFSLYFPFLRQTCLYHFIVSYSFSNEEAMNWKETMKLRSPIEKCHKIFVRVRDRIKSSVSELLIDRKRLFDD